MNDFLLNLSSEKLNDLNFYISHNLQVFAKLYLIYMTIKWYFGTLCTSKWCSLGFCAIGLLVFKGVTCDPFIVKTWNLDITTNSVSLKVQIKKPRSNITTSLRFFFHFSPPSNILKPELQYNLKPMVKRSLFWYIFLTKLWQLFC